MPVNLTATRLTFFERNFDDRLATMQWPPVYRFNILNMENMYFTVNDAFTVHLTVKTTHFTVRLTVDLLLNYFIFYLLFYVNLLLGRLSASFVRQLYCKCAKYPV